MMMNYLDINNIKAHKGLYQARENNNYNFHLVKTLFTRLTNVGV